MNNQRNPYQPPESSIISQTGANPRSLVDTTLSWFCWIVAGTCFIILILFIFLLIMMSFRYDWRKVLPSTIKPQMAGRFAMAIVGTTIYMMAGLSFSRRRRLQGTTLCLVGFGMIYLFVWLMKP